MTKDFPRTLARAVTNKLTTLPPVPAKVSEADYTTVVARVTSRVPALRAQIERNQTRVQEHYLDLVDQPAGRRATVIANSSPTMLAALAYDLTKQSHDCRFNDPKRSLELASLALDTAQAVADTAYLSAHSTADLLAEVLGHLGNARRINSDVAGAERAFQAAEQQFSRGTCDRALRAQHSGFRAALCYSQGQAGEAAEFWDREVALRRLLGEPERLGVALVDRGLVACWEGDLELASELIRQGIEKVNDYRMIYLGLVNLAEAFARQDKGADAWKLLCTADLPGGLTDVGTLEVRYRWVKAITYRAMGQPLDGERLLLDVVGDFEERGFQRTAAIAAVDLLAIYAAQGKQDELILLAQEVYSGFLAENLERRALSVFLILHRAIQKRAQSEELAVRVANFLVRFQHDRNARFEKNKG